MLLSKKLYSNMTLQILYVDKETLIQSEKKMGFGDLILELKQPGLNADLRTYVLQSIYK